MIFIAKASSTVDVELAENKIDSIKTDQKNGDFINSDKNKLNIHFLESSSATKKIHYDLDPEIPLPVLPESHNNIISNCIIKLLSLNFLNINLIFLYFKIKLKMKKNKTMNLKLCQNLINLY